MASFWCDLSPLLLGLILDKYGPKICSAVATTCVTFGFLLFSIVDADKTSYFMISVSLIAFGGTGNQIAM